MANIIGKKIKEISELYKSNEKNFNDEYIEYISANFNINRMPVDYIYEFTCKSLDFTGQEYSLQDLLYEYSKYINIEMASALKMNFSEIKRKLTELELELNNNRIQTRLDTFKQKLINDYDCLKHPDTFDALEFVAYVYINSIVHS